MFACTVALAATPGSPAQAGEPNGESATAAVEEAGNAGAPSDVGLIDVATSEPGPGENEATDASGANESQPGDGDTTSGPTTTEAALGTENGNSVVSAEAAPLDTAPPEDDAVAEAASESATASASSTQNAPTNTTVTIRNDSPGENPSVDQENTSQADAAAGAGEGQDANAVAESNQVGASNTNVSVRVNSPGDDGDVTQTNTSEASAAAANDAGAGAYAGASSAQVDPSNTNISVRVDSPGAGGEVTQTNSATAPVSGEATGPANVACETLDPAASSCQIAPYNTNVSIRVGSEGADDIDPFQQSLAEVQTGAFNTNVSLVLVEAPATIVGAATESDPALQAADAQVLTAELGWYWTWDWVSNGDPAELGPITLPDGWTWDWSWEGDKQDFGASSGGTSALEVAASSSSTGTWTWTWVWTRDGSWEWNWNWSKPCDCSWTWSWDWAWTTVDATGAAATGEQPIVNGTKNATATDAGSNSTGGIHQINASVASADATNSVIGAGACNAAESTGQCVQSNEVTLIWAGGVDHGTTTVWQSNEITAEQDTGVCNAASSTDQCHQANEVTITWTGTSRDGDATVSQSNHISGGDTAGAGGVADEGDNNTGVCNAAASTGQCAQTNAGSITQSAEGETATNEATISQGNERTGRDSGGAGSGGVNITGVCNAASSDAQCGQANEASLTQSAYGETTTNEATIRQRNELAGRDSRTGSSGEDANTAGVCNAANSTGQCWQTNTASIVRSAEVGTGYDGTATNTADLDQTNQLAGRDSNAVGTYSGSGGNDPVGVCNAASSTDQCTQANTGTITQTAQGGSGYHASATNTADVEQSNQLAGRDNTGTAGTAAGPGGNVAGVCNAAASTGQCGQSNEASLTQTAEGGRGYKSRAENTTALVQSNQLAGRDNTGADGRASSGSGDNDTGVCNTASSTGQCTQANEASLTQTAEGGRGYKARAENTTALLQSNQLAGRDNTGTRGRAGSGSGDNGTGVCNSASATKQCRQVNEASVAQKAKGGCRCATNRTKLAQSNQLAGRDNVGVGARAGRGSGANGAGVCNAGLAKNQCRQTNKATVKQNAYGRSKCKAGGAKSKGGTAKKNTTLRIQRNIKSRRGCNADVAKGKCRQTNKARISQRGKANKAKLKQSNQIAGRNNWNRPRR